MYIEWVHAVFHLFFCNICNILCKSFQFARQFSQNEPATLEWLCHQVKWPFSTPNTILDLVHLEEVFDVFDLYLWLR